MYCNQCFALHAASLVCIHCCSDGVEQQHSANEVSIVMPPTVFLSTTITLSEAGGLPFKGHHPESLDCLYHKRCFPNGVQRQYLCMG